MTRRKLRKESSVIWFISLRYPGWILPWLIPIHYPNHTLVFTAISIGFKSTKRNFIAFVKQLHLHGNFIYSCCCWEELRKDIFLSWVLKHGLASNKPKHYCKTTTTSMLQIYLLPWIVLYKKEARKYKILSIGTFTNCR